MDRKCPQCSAPFLESQRFCRYCGFRLDEGLQDYVETRTFKEATSPAPQRVEVPSGYPAWSPSGISETQGLTHSARRSKILIGILGLILMCALGVGIASFVASNRAPISFSNTEGVGGPVSYLGVYFDEDQPGGAFIREIPEEGWGGPADKAGLIGGDLIIEANEKPIRSVREMRQVLASTPPGSELHLKFLRDGQELSAVLITTEKGKFTPLGAKVPYGYFGINPGDLRRVSVPGKNISGVELEDVFRNDPADMAGIRDGDIVIEFNGHPVRTPRDFLRRIRQTDPYSTVEVKIIRRGEELIIPVKMGHKDG